VRRSRWTPLPPLNAGVAQQIITPATNMWMVGNAARKKPAEGKVQELYAKALALEDGAGKRFSFVTLDLIGILPSLRTRMKEKVARKYGLPPESFLLNASYTHSGPEYRVEKGHEKEAQEYTVFWRSN
jgi:neutral ceramidase